MKKVFAFFGKKDNLRQRFQLWLRRSWFVIFAIVSFLAFTAYYMGPSVSACNDTVYGFGDNTAGPIWKYDLPNDQPPLGAFQDFTNHPFGESLYSPVGFSLILQSALIWTFDKVAGPVCGYNLVNAFGFFTSALVMCGFVYWLTRKRSIAWLAGYAVAFAPYFQYKVGGHPSYGYVALLIGVLWLFLKVVRDKQKKDALFLAIVTAACFYWDPYFSLLAILTLFPLIVFWALYKVYEMRKAKNNKQVKQSFILQAKRIGLAFGAFLLLITPLFAVRIGFDSQISQYVGGGRGDVMIDAKMCSILPWDYVLPADDNWFINKFVSPKVADKIRELRHGCNPSEYTVGISAIILFITTLGLTLFAWEKLNRRKIFASNNIRHNMLFITMAVATMTAFAAIMALPPILGNLKFPSYLLLDATTTWRILTRIYIVVSIGVTTLFAVCLVYFSQLPFLKNKKIKIALWIAVFFAIFAQYQAFGPFDGSKATFSYSKDVPAIYTWLKDQSEIDYIAAYPMDKVGESEAIGVYVTVQRVHGKKLLNSTLPNSPHERLRYSIKDLTDPQTIPVLRHLGVDAVVIHGIPLEELQAIGGLTVLKYEFFQSSITGGHVAVAKINDGPTLSQAIVLEKGFPINSTIMKSAMSVEFEAMNNSTLAVRGVSGQSEDSVQRLCFEVKTADPNETDRLVVKVGDAEIMNMPIYGSYQSATFIANSDEDLTLQSASGHNMRLNNLGCK